MRNLAYALYSRNPNRRRDDINWRDFIQKRDRAATLVTAAKKRYGDRFFSPHLPAKKLWSNLRREGVHNNAKKNLPAEQIDVEQLNTFFCEGHRQLQTDQTTTARVEQQDTRRIGREEDNRAQFRFRQTNAGEVALKINEIQTNATGADGIPISFVKLLCPFIFPMLVDLYNSIIDSKTFPVVWKKGIVTPIPKVSNPVLPKDFRPITVLPAISKVLEKILLDQIVEYIDGVDTQLLAKCQSGYRKQYSTTTALAKITHDIYNSFDRDHCTVMVLVDFSLAFNSVNHQKLRTKLGNEFNFTLEACELVASFLGHRSQAVKVGSDLSTEHPLTDGTPQGSCLSALLFSLYVNSLPLGLKCSYQLYADDLQIYISGPKQEIDRLIAVVNADLQYIERWAKENSLSPNPKKTQAIIFCRDGEITPNSDIKFCSESIQKSGSVTNLGLQMDRNLRWSNQVNEITKKVFGTLHTFRRFSPVLTTQTRKKLVQAVVMPFFTYCDVVYHPGLSVAQKEQLNRCFKAAVRFVYGMRRRDSTAAVRNTILGHDLATNYRIRICCFMRQGYYNNLPDYLLQHLQRGTQERSRSFTIPHHTTSQRKSVLITGALTWNELPLQIKQKPTMTAFKEAIKSIQ